MKQFIIENEEKQRILEMHKYATQKNYLNSISESETGKVIVNEQTTLLNIPSMNIMMVGSPGNEQQIMLKGTDPKTNVSSVLKYNVEGKYKGIGFKVKLRNFGRYKDGSLYVEAQPNNLVVKNMVKALIPSESLTNDGWIKNKIPKEKIDSSIASLKQNNGSNASLDAGHGVTINLSLAN